MQTFHDACCGKLSDSGVFTDFHAIGDDTWLLVYVAPNYAVQLAAPCCHPGVACVSTSIERRMTYTICEISRMRMAIEH